MRQRDRLRGAVCLALCASLGLIACGGARRGTPAERPAARTTSAKAASSGQASPPRFGDYDADDYGHGHADSDGDDTAKPTDGDGDSDNPTGSYYDADDGRVRGFGHPADATDRRIVVTLVHRFYAAAGARDGRRACALLASAFVQIAAEFHYRQTGGRRSDAGTACRQAMAELFARDAAEYSRAAGLSVASVLVKGNEALAVLSSRSLPAVRVVREHGGWKLAVLFDRQLP